MCGFSSGRKRSLHAKPMTSHLHAIDIRKWQREGLLHHGFSFTRVWHQQGESVAQIRVRPLCDRIQVAYTALPPAGRTLVQECIIPVVRTRCRLGGARSWFLCPQPGCGRRVAVLYERGGFACRHCHGLAYPSQRESAAQRALRKADQIRLRLGWEPWMCSANGARPKGMHMRTFNHLRSQRASLMIQALSGAKDRLESVERFLDGRK